MARINWNKIKKHINKPIICSFVDHSSREKLVKCNALGYLAEIGDDYIMIVTWDCPEMDEVNRLNNLEFYGIIKSAIIDIKPLKVTNVWG